MTPDDRFAVRIGMARVWLACTLLQARARLRGWAPWLFVLAACSTPAILKPATGPGTSYPCGVEGVVCGGGMCCPEGHVCGGGPFNGCPAGACCFVGDDGVARDAGADAQR